MDAAKLEMFRELLKNRLAALVKGAGESIGDLVEERESLSDAVDIASEESSREFTLRLHEHDLALVKEIRAALHRIENGDYGYCANCGEEIAEKRLLARPMATHCIDCKTEVELKERGQVQRFTNFE
jgi:DnaK suppressor protein